MKQYIPLVFFITLFAVAALADDPGVNALVQSSTDILVAKVVSTNPRKAIEGARDTVVLQVVRTLKGSSKQGETVSVYYHLHWLDTKTWELEPKKFEIGKECVVFLKSHRLISGSTSTLEYELTDQWLSVQGIHPHLEKSIVTQVEQSQKKLTQ